MTSETRPAPGLHIEPTASGRWVVCYEHHEQPLSDHLTASEAQGSAQRRARTEGIAVVLTTATRGCTRSRPRRDPLGCPLSTRPRHHLCAVRLLWTVEDLAAVLLVPAASDLAAELSVLEAVGW